ncbi:MAG: HEAT repeat domain-containing protein [Anaerolineae bacterium]|nr:HEAT repeat domain-containing protein [Anaerolineae bacterium]
MLGGLLLRRMIAGILVLLLVAAAIYRIAANLDDPALFLAGPILGMAGLLGRFSSIRGRFVAPDQISRRKPPADAVRNADAYLEGRLRQFDSESKLFVELAGDTLIQTTFRSKGHPFEDIQQAIELHKGRFVLIGEPGAGKSTTLRQLMIKAIHDYRLKTNPRLPVWINLGLSGTPIHADDLLQFWWDEQAYLPGTPDEYIQQDAVWLFMDGLNEMPLDSRAERARALKAFLDKHPTLPVIVTCRVRDYEEDEHLYLGLPIVRVHELDEGRIQEFISKRGASTDLWDKIRSNDALRRMADNPYKLVMLMAVYQARRELPERLEELYGLYVKEAYLTRTKATNAPPLGLTWPKLETRLKRLAYLMIQDGKGTAANVEWAWRKIGKRALMDGINLGMLVVDGEDVRFYHQSLHGFFAVDQLRRVFSTEGKSTLNIDRVVVLTRQIGDLGEAGLPALDILIRALRDANPAVRTGAAEAIAKLGPSALEPLISALYDTKRGVPIGAAEAIAKLGPSALEPLISALGDTNPDVRTGAAMALTGLKDRRSLEPLLTALEDSDWQVRREVAFALGVLNDDRAIEGLTRRLEDSHGEVRNAVVLALWQLRASPPIEGLIAALKDPDVSVTRAMVGALAEIGTGEAISGLVEVLRDADHAIRMDIIAALKQFGTKSTLPLLGLLSDADQRVRAIAAEALGNVDDPRILAPLMRALNDSASEVRINAAEALGKLGDLRAVEPLIRALYDSAGGVRESAAGALGKLNDARAIEPLIEALSDPNMLVQTQAMNALAAMRTPQAVEPLTSLLTNTGTYMERKVVWALREIGTPEALAAIEQWEQEQQN